MIINDRLATKLITDHSGKNIHQCGLFIDEEQGVQCLGLNTWKSQALSFSIVHLKKRPLEMGWLGPRKSCLLFRISLAQLVRVWGTKRQNCQEIKTSNADNLKTQGNWVINKGAGISISYPVEFWEGEFACKGAITWRYKGFIMVMLNHAIILLISQLYYLYYNYITWRYKGSSWWD